MERRDNSLDNCQPSLGIREGLPREGVKEKLTRTEERAVVGGPGRCQKSSEPQRPLGTLGNALGRVGVSLRHTAGR